jgi:hypothetical protein
VPKKTIADSINSRMRFPLCRLFRGSVPRVQTLRDQKQSKGLVGTGLQARRQTAPTLLTPLRLAEWNMLDIHSDTSVELRATFWKKSGEIPTAHL